MQNFKVSSEKSIEYLVENLSTKFYITIIDNTQKDKIQDKDGDELKRYISI